MAVRECDCKEFQDSGHTDECNGHYRTLVADLVNAKAVFQQRAILAAIGVQPDSVNHQVRTRESGVNNG